MKSLTPKELRPRSFLIAKIADLLDAKQGRRQLADMIGCSKDTIDKACASRDLTVEDMTKLIAEIGAIVGNEPLDRIADELATYFIPPRRKLIYDELIEEQSRINLAFLNGGRLVKRSEFHCPNCGQLLMPEMQSGYAVLLTCKNPPCVAMRAGF